MTCNVASFVLSLFRTFALQQNSCALHRLLTKFTDQQSDFRGDTKAPFHCFVLFMSMPGVGFRRPSKDRIHPASDTVFRTFRGGPWTMVDHSSYHKDCHADLAKLQHGLHSTAYLFFISYHHRVINECKK